MVRTARFISQVITAQRTPPIFGFKVNEMSISQFFSPGCPGNFYGIEKPRKRAAIAAISLLWLSQSNGVEHQRRISFSVVNFCRHTFSLIFIFFSIHFDSFSLGCCHAAACCSSRPIRSSFNSSSTAAGGRTKAWSLSLHSVEPLCAFVRERLFVLLPLNL